MVVAGTFLREFINKSANGSENIQYKVLFENFIKDLLVAVSKPEWPAADLLLCLLGKILVSIFHCTNTNISKRLLSLEFLGNIAANLRKNYLGNEAKIVTIDEMLRDIQNNEKLYEMNEDGCNEERKMDTLQRCLLDFLLMNSKNDESYKQALHFYIIQWYVDCVKYGSFSNSYKNTTPKRILKKYTKNDQHEGIESARRSTNDTKRKLVDLRKLFLINNLTGFGDFTFSEYKAESMDYNRAVLVVEFLASKRFFSQSFDQYLKAILLVMEDPSISMRTKAMKCLTTIIETDPSILEYNNVQINIKRTFLDNSAAVRETAVELVGKFVISRPEILSRFYDMLSARIKDSGLNVRKRVIRVFKDVCLKTPKYHKIGDICVSIIKRINDEESIRRLILELFQMMWFSGSSDIYSLEEKVEVIVKVIQLSDQAGLEYLAKLLCDLLNPKEMDQFSTKIDAVPSKDLIHDYEKIVKYLITKISEFDLAKITSSSTELPVVGWFNTLQLFTKVKPELLINHFSCLESYLRLDGKSLFVLQILNSTVCILKSILPLLAEDNPLVAILENDIMKLALTCGPPVADNCLSLLGDIVNKFTRNYVLIEECFVRQFSYLVQYKLWWEENNLDELNKTENRTKFRAALFIIGNVFKHFDFNMAYFKDGMLNRDQDVYRLLIFFLQIDRMKVNVLQAIGGLCRKHDKYMLETDLQNFYHEQLTPNTTNEQVKIAILINIKDYLLEGRDSLVRQDLGRKNLIKNQSLKEMCDSSSCVASSVIQVYIDKVMNSYLSSYLQIRRLVQLITQLILEQDLVQPVQLVPYLICMATDPDKVISCAADQHLLYTERKYPHFILPKSSLGLWLSYLLQRVFLKDTSITRGFRLDNRDYLSAINGYFYSLVRKSKLYRHSFIMNILKKFEEPTTSLYYLLYLADNLAYFPYQVQEEPLFILYHIDLMVSMSGTNLLESFHKSLILPDWVRNTKKEPKNDVEALDEDEDEEALLTRVPDDTRKLEGIMKSAQSYILLLYLRKFLKNSYHLTDGTVQLYSPSEPRNIYAKPTVRKSNVIFKPETTLQILELEYQNTCSKSGDRKKDLIDQYIKFKKFIMDLDGEPENVRTVATNISNEIHRVQLNKGTSQEPRLKTTKSMSLKKNSSKKITPQKMNRSRKRKRRSRRNDSDEESEDDYSDPDFIF